MKLYPPQLEGSLPAFYKTSEKNTILKIPFSMNRAVSPSEVYGYSLRVKDIINSDELFTVNTANHSSTTEAAFTLDITQSIQLVVGSYYKFQLAYIDKDGITGYYSTVGVVKCTSQPIVEIEGLDLSLNNNHKYFYTGYYYNGNDPTEKVYSYQFILRDQNNQIVSDSGQQIHLFENNTDVNYESIDTYNIPFDLEDNDIYLLEYIITTNNGLVMKSPRYRIIQTSFIDMTEQVKLETSSSFDEGYIDLSVVYDADDQDTYVLDSASERTDFVDYYNQEYQKVTITEDDYLSNTYFVFEDNSYILDESTEFDITKTYYLIHYSLVKLTDLTYEPNKYYIKKEHFVKGNFLISRSCRDTNYKEWYKICDIHIDGYGKVFYETRDFTLEQGKYYRYSIQQYNNFGTLSKRKITGEIFADFEDMFLYDGKKQLKIRYNPKISSFKINKIINKVDTIGGKYPYIFENSTTYYHEFPISGLISYLMDNNELFNTFSSIGLNEEYHTLGRSITYEEKNIKEQILENLYQISVNSKIIKDGKAGYNNKTTQEILQLEKQNNFLNEQNKELKVILQKKYTKNKVFDREEYSTTNLTSKNIAAERMFKTQVLDWLNDGEPKLFRSPGEGNFIVVLTNVSLTPEDRLNRMLHTFSATAYEIADFNQNNLNNLKLSNNNDKINYNFLLWKTINLSEELALNNIDDNYFTNENNKSVLIYRGDVLYNYEEVLRNNTAYSIYLTGLKPNSLIMIDGEEVLIGATGSYYYESSDGINSLMVPENITYTGNLTYNYYGDLPSSFDTILESKVSSYSGIQFIGENKDIISQITSASSSVKNFGYLQFMMRDIIEVTLADEDDWDNLYYKDNKCEERILFLDSEDDLVDTTKDIYYYSVPNRLDFGLMPVNFGDSLKPNITYYKNNRQGLNPLYTDILENKDLYYCIYREGFYYNNEKVNIYNNYYPLYKYMADKIVIDNNIQTFEEPLLIYKDIYRNKYYIDEETKVELEEELYNQLINDYGFELLTFEIIIDNIDTFTVGPTYTHIKRGKLFSPYEEVSINSQEEFDSYSQLYILSDTNYIQTNTYDEEEIYYIYQDFRNFVFYTTASCLYQVPVDRITAEKSKQYYILDTIEVVPDYNVEHVRVLKDIYNFNSLQVGNGVVLNCAYQTNDTMYALENINSIDNKYNDSKLNYIISQLNEYKKILDNNFEENNFATISLTDLDGIIEYYKNELLEEVASLYGEDSDYEDAQIIISKYSQFLSVYNNYLAGEITDLTDFREALGDNGELLRTINSLIEEKVMIQENAKQQYIKYLKLYHERIEQLLTIYNEEG